MKGVCPLLPRLQRDKLVKSNEWSVMRECKF